MFNWPFRKDIEVPSVLASLGDISSLNVLDFGCGTGYYARLLSQQGAGRVVGFDVAGGMLEYARERERENPAGIEYISKIPLTMNKKFDLILAVYVLPYATNYELLQDMVSTMARLLSPGGRLLTLPLNPEYNARSEYYEPYGFQLSSETPYQDGSEVRLRFPQRSAADICASYWSRAAIDRALTHSNFEVTSWRNPQAFGNPAENLHAYLAHPHTVLVDCQLR
ncbi:TPA: class I SAM-dependent methyltransferase [Serratia rubidaea]|nr:class I SAM-dependent methyltransferase [Serratia rubidaea]